MPSTVLVVGASGVIGAGAVERFARAGWDVIALSRRKPVLPDDVRFEHRAVDLTDEAACRDLVASLGTISHLVYAAVAEVEGLWSGWTDPDMIDLNRRMFANIATPLAERGGLAWTGLLQGTKAYGVHLHDGELPSREDEPRDPHANFYWEHEDCMRGLAARHGFHWTIFRPQVLFGGAPRAAMNPAAAIGAYAAICRELDVPFAYPSRFATMWEMTDALLLADAIVWAAGAQVARDQIYNITNGDMFVLRDAWRDIAAAAGLDRGEAVQRSLAQWFAEPEQAAAWDRVVARYDLLPMSLAEFVGQSHHYVDLLLDSSKIEQRGMPKVISGIKIRKAGFTECGDSRDSLLFWLQRMGETRLLPPDLF